jgi:hypothetical protein
LIGGPGRCVTRPTNHPHASVERPIIRTGGLVIISLAASTKSGPRAATKTRVSVQGVVSIFDGREDINPPVPLLKLPANAGDTWTVGPRENRRGPVAGHTCKVIGEEVVEVPAGKFTAIRVDSVYPADGADSTVSRWFAPNVGLVKMDNGGGSRTAVLKSFTPGK